MKRTARKVRFGGAWLAVLAGIGAGLAISTVRAGAGAEEENLVNEFHRPLSWLVRQIQSESADEVEPKDMLAGACQGMLNSLDDYSAYWSQERATEATDDLRGKFGGLGIQISYDRDKKAVRVEQPISGTPAARQGVLARDLIIEVREMPDGEVVSTSEFEDVHDAVRVLRGEVGSDVQITVVHEKTGEKEEIVIRRAEIRIPGVRAVEMVDVDRKIGYLHVAYFSEPVSRDLRNAMRDLIDLGAEAVVIDLRLNPGGLLDQAEDCTDLFLPGDELIVTIRDRDGREERHMTEHGGTFGTIPLVVLVNRASASGAEILAGALRDHQRAVLVGEPTYGKASVQKLYPFPNRFDRNAAFKLTVAHYYTPDGTDIDKKGVEPHILVELPDDEARRLSRHLSRKTDYPPPPPDSATGDLAASEDEGPDGFRDVQLGRAVEVAAEMMAGRTAPEYIADLSATGRSETRTD